MSYYDCEIQVEDGQAFIVSDVFGRIPVPPELSEGIIQTNKDFLTLVSSVHSALQRGDTSEAELVVDEMERRWGPMQTQIRSLRWQILEDFCHEE
jgi:hypothetical protein